MGRFAETLYRTFCSTSGLNYGSDETPSFHNLPTEKREAWQQVARVAATHVLDQAAGVLMSLTSNALAELRARFQ